jgi:hypothetical protein
MKADISTLHKPDILILRRHFADPACVHCRRTAKMHRNLVELFYPFFRSMIEAKR